MLKTIKTINRDYQNPPTILTGDFNKPKWKEQIKLKKISC